MSSSSNVEKQFDSSNELQITVTGRKTGKEYSTPVWFVREGKTILLLPVKGSQSQWYKNVEKSRKMTISSGKIKLKLNAKLVKDSNRIGVIADKFRKKYGASDVKKYYSNFDAGIELSI